MGTLKCMTCGGRGVVVESGGSTYSSTFGAWYPAESEERCADCHGSGELCCVECGGTPELEDLEHGQPWCTECWVHHRDRRKSPPPCVLAPLHEGEGCDLPF
jgi:hypothetical protein